MYPGYPGFELHGEHQRPPTIYCVLLTFEITVPELGLTGATQGDRLIADWVMASLLLRVATRAQPYLYTHCAATKKQTMLLARTGLGKLGSPQTVNLAVGPVFGASSGAVRAAVAWPMLADAAKLRTGKIRHVLSENPLLVKHIVRTAALKEHAGNRIAVRSGTLHQFRP